MKPVCVPQVVGWCSVTRTVCCTVLFSSRCLRSPLLVSHVLNVVMKPLFLGVKLRGSLLWHHCVLKVTHKGLHKQRRRITLCNTQFWSYYTTPQLGSITTLRTWLRLLKNTWLCINFSQRNFCYLAKLIWMHLQYDIRIHTYIQTPLKLAFSMLMWGLFRLAPIILTKPF